MKSIPGYVEATAIDSIPRAKKFGELLIQHGFISEQQLKEALHHQEKTPHKPVGEICVDLGFISTVALKVVLDRFRKQKLLGSLLLKMGVVSVDQLSEALSLQKRGGKRLGQILLDKGYISKTDLADALSAQLGIPKIVPNVYMVDETLLSKATPEYFRRHRAVPLLRVVASGDRNEEIVTVLMEDPLDITLIADLAKIFNAEIQPAVSAALDIEDFLNEVFDVSRGNRLAEDVNDQDMPLVHRSEEVSSAGTDVPTGRARPKKQNCSIMDFAAQGDGAKGVGKDAHSVELSAAQEGYGRRQK